MDNQTENKVIETTEVVEAPEVTEEVVSTGPVFVTTQEVFDEFEKEFDEFPQNFLSYVNPYNFRTMIRNTKNGLYTYAEKHVDGEGAYFAPVFDPDAEKNKTTEKVHDFRVKIY